MKKERSLLYCRSAKPLREGRQVRTFAMLRIRTQTQTLTAEYWLLIRQLLTAIGKQYDTHLTDRPTTTTQRLVPLY